MSLVLSIFEYTAKSKIWTTGSITGVLKMENIFKH